MKRISRFFFFTLFFLAFVLRIFLSFNSKHGDMYNNWDWGQGAWTYGLSQVYDVPQHAWPHSWPNQPPGSLYLHAVSYWLSTSVGYVIWHPGITVKILPSHFIWWWEVSGPLISLKLPSIFADFAIAWVILRFGKLWHRPKTAALVALIYLFNPALWYNSAFWGQTDSVVAALSLLSLVFLLEGRLILSPIFLGLSLITKASWIPIVPLYLFYWWKNYRSDWPKIFLAPAVFFLLALPFHPHLDLPVWFTQVYLTRIISGESSWITVIAFNFWNLFFPSSYTPVTTPIFGIPAIYIAWTIVAVFLALILKYYSRKPSREKFIYACMLLFFVIFLFAPKMLQRYLYPVFPLLSVVLIFTRRKIYWLIYGLISFCYLANMYYLWWAPGNPALENFYTPAFTKGISIIYLAAFTYLYVKKAV